MTHGEKISETKGTKGRVENPDRRMSSENYQRRAQRDIDRYHYNSPYTPEDINQARQFAH